MSIMDKIFDYLAVHSHWLTPFVPILFVFAYLAIEDRWAAYSRLRNYEELKVLNDLREKNVITQEEFNEKKEELLSA